MANKPKAEIEIALDTRLADATLGDFERVMKSAFGGGAKEAKTQAKKIEDAVTKLEKSFKSSFANIAGAFHLAEKGWRTLSKAGQQWIALSEKHEARVGELKKAYAGLTNEVGKATASSGTFKGSLESTTAALEDLTDFFKSPAGLRAIDSFFDSIVLGSADAIDAILGARKVFADFGATIYEWAKVNPAFGVPAAILEQLGLDPKSLLPDIGEIDSTLATLAEGLRASAGRGVEGVDRPAPKEFKEEGRHGAIGTSGLIETFTATELGISDIEILKADVAEYEKLQDQVFDAKLEHMARMADLDTQELVRQRQEVDFRNELRAEEFAEETRFFNQQKEQLASWAEFGKLTTDLLASSMNNAIASMTESLVTGSSNITSILFNMLSDILLQLGAFFSAQASTNWALVVPTEGGTLPQAIGYTAAAAAAFAGAGALRGVASNAAKGRGKQQSGSFSGSSAPAGSGSGGGLLGGGFGPAAPSGRSDGGGEGRTVIVHINKPIGSPARHKRELMEILGT